MPHPTELRRTLIELRRTITELRRILKTLKNTLENSFEYVMEVESILKPMA